LKIQAYGALLDVKKRVNAFFENSLDRKGFFENSLDRKGSR
jgi:hypothetical protein